MIYKDNGNLLELQKEARSIADEVQELFGALTKEQLNWRPNPKSWSIAQCLDHLIAANRNYFPIFEEIILGERKKRILERFPFLAHLWAWLLINSFRPGSKRKLKAPKIFMPSASDFDCNVIPQFSDNQGRLIGFMQATAFLDLRHTLITSPATRFVTYSLCGAYEIILQHERRHMAQARRVMGAKNFPNGTVKSNVRQKQPQL